MKWLKLYCSVLLFGAITLAIIIQNAHSTEIVSAGFGFAMIFWLFLNIISPIVLFSRIMRYIANPDSFFYISIGTANLTTGTAGLCLFLPSPAPDGRWIVNVLIANILIGIFVMIDTFIHAIPGYQKPSSKEK